MSIEDFRLLANVLETGKSDSIQNSTLGAISVDAGHTGKNGYGLRHIIEQRWFKDKITDENAIVALLYCVVDSAKNGSVVRDVTLTIRNKITGSISIEKNGIVAFLSKTRGDTPEKFIITGFMQFDKKEVATDAIQTVIAQYGYTPEFSDVRKQVVAVTALPSLYHNSENKSSDFEENPQKNNDFSKEASMEAVFEYNADKLTRAVEAGTAPFFENGVPGAVYFADSGKLVPGMNQVLAQMHMRETGAKDFRIVTRAAALRAGSPVNEGAKPLLLCEVNTYDMTSKVFHLFRAEDTAHHEKFPQPLPMPQASVKSIEAKSGEPEKYLSDYLTAVAAGAPFSASRDVKAGFQTNFMKEVKSAPLPFSKTYDIFDDARKLCIAQLHSIYKDTLEQKQERDRMEKEKQRADKSAAKTKGALAHGDEGRNRAGQNG